MKNICVFLLISGVLSAFGGCGHDEVKKEKKVLGFPVPKFSEMVSEKELEKSINFDEFSEDNELRTANLLLIDSVYRRFGTKKMYEVIHQYDYFFSLDEVEAESRYYKFFKKLFDWKKGILDCARKELKNPKKLWQTYKTLKPAVLKIIKRRTKASEAKDYITQILIPGFEKYQDKRVLDYYALEKQIKDLSEEIFAEEQKRQGEAENKKLANLEDNLNNMLERMDGLSFDNNYEVEWMMRRYNEGGETLVKMWINVFFDIAKSL